METMIEIMVNGLSLRVNRNVTLLQILQEKGNPIPSLCFNPLLGGYGSCGLCLIEVFSPDGWQLQHSCLLYPKQNLRIRTTSNRIKQVRAQAAQLLLGRGPFSKQEVKELLTNAMQEGNQNPKEINDEILNSPFKGCILCGLCVRICQRIGRNNLTFLGRGKNMHIGMVTNKGESCGSCQACKHICPTGYITTLFPKTES